MDARRAAGLGLLAYGVLTPVAFMTIGAPGGAYEEHAVATYLASSHWALAFGLAYLGAFAGLGLLVFGTRMGELVGAAGPVVRGLGVAGAAAGVIGWFLVGGISVAFAEGSRPVVANVPHSVVYLVSEISNLVAVCASAFFLGATALVLAGALRETLPRWLRILTYVAGPCGLFAPVFFPLFLFWLWTIAFAVWLVRVPGAAVEPVIDPRRSPASREGSPLR